MSFDYLMGYIISISMCMPNFIIIFHSVQCYFYFFRIWSSSKPRPMKNIIWQSLGLDLVNINVYAKVYQNINTQFKRYGYFHFFRIWTSAKPRPIPNDIWHLLGYHCVCKILSKYSKRFKSNLHTKLPQISTLESFVKSSGVVWCSWHFSIGHILTATECTENCFLKKWFMLRHKELDIINKSSQTGRRQNLHKLSGDKISWLS